MEIEIRQDLHLKQQQQLVLTPQLKQAIKLLQLSKIELLEVIKEEIKTNPVLEEKDPYTSEESSEAELDLSETESISDDIGDIGWDAYFEEYQDEYWYDKSRFICVRRCRRVLCWFFRNSNFNDKLFRNR